MLEKLNDLPPGLEGLKAVGEVSRDDYRVHVEPMIEDARRHERRIRLLYQFGPEFERFTPGAAWEDAKLGLRSLRVCDGAAVVTDIGWLREAVRAFGVVMPCPVRVFPNRKREEAARWLASLEEGAAVSHHLLTETGVIVVEVHDALRAQDLDALANTADAWIASHGSLRGMVVHARRFPGWENVPSFVRHLRFIRRHHEKIGRVALASDGMLANIGPWLAESFVDAEVRSFPYDALDAAIAWAATAKRGRSRDERRREVAERRAH